MLLPGAAATLTDWISFLAVLLLVPLNYFLVIITDHITASAAPLMLLLNALILPSFVIWHYIQHPGIATLGIVYSMAHLLKLTSFLLAKTHQPTIKHLIYFYFAPTLCYQEEYPRSDHRFRLKYFMRQVLEFVTVCATGFFIAEQYCRPALEDSLALLAKMHTLESNWAVAGWALDMLSHLLGLSVGTSAVWLCGFYAFFHAYMHAAAELLGFGDRAFYRAWWNASSVLEYWRLWNLPVHNFLKRHVYTPLIHTEMKREKALFITFFVSALLHELLVAIPAKQFSGMAFGAMLGQAALVRLPLDRTTGNLVFWLVFCVLGQPLLVTIYYWRWASRFL